MSSVLIIGASRGIGLGLVRAYRAAGWRVIATARTPEDLAALQALGAETHRLDVNQVEAVAGFGWKLDGEQLDVAILNAGVFGPKGEGFPTESDFDLVMHTNVLAAMRLLPIIAPMVAAAKGKLAVMSSRMGSMGLRQSGNATLYRSSKAALNSVLVDTALTFGPQGATCVAFHPGWVRTDMGGASAELEVDESARDLHATLGRLSPADNGSFLNHDGQPLSW